MARDLVKAGHEVIWLAPAMENIRGEIHLPTVNLRLPSPMGWIVTVLVSLFHHRKALGKIDAVFTWSEYDSLALLLYPATKNAQHTFLQGGDSVECETFIARNAERLRRRLKSRFMVFYYPTFQRFLGRRIERVIVQAQFLGKLLRARCPDANWTIDVIPGNTRFDDPIEDNDPGVEDKIEALKDGGLTLGVVGQCFYRAKGWDLFMEAMTLLKGEPGIRAFLIGYGDEAHLIEEAIAEKGLSDNVHFLGRVGAAFRFMPQFDVIVAPTRFLDACPTVILEAMATDRMIVGSDIPGHKALLGDPTLMFKSGDARALADYILALRDNEELREKNRTLVRGRREVFDFDWEGEMVRMLEAYGRGERYASENVKPLED